MATVHHRHQVHGDRVLRVAEHAHTVTAVVTHTDHAADGHYHAMPETEAERKWPPLTSEPLMPFDAEEVPM